MLSDASDREPVIDVDENDLAVLMYTGGTTGLPKGVMMSHRNLMTAVLSATSCHGIYQGRFHLFCLPLFHVSFWPAFSVLHGRRQNSDQSKARFERYFADSYRMKMLAHQRGPHPLRMAASVRRCQRL
jgi:long-subunit acyl-CoA synthetase (AMP-forming)